MPIALVTGATAGLGAEFARQLASSGTDLVLLARDEPRLAASAARLQTAYGVRVEVLPADLSTDEGIARAEDRLGRGVDLLVNNAGFGNHGRYLQAPVADEVRMLKVHCEAVLRLTSAALPGMIERGRGGVVNVASVAGFFARGTYSASKAWVIMFSQGAAQDIAGTGVTVMALCPGFVHTEFHERARMDTGGIPGVLWLRADQVVREALRDLRRGRTLCVPDVRYKTLVGIGRLIPRGLAGRVAARTGRRYD